MLLFFYFVDFTLYIDSAELMEVTISQLTQYVVITVYAADGAAIIIIASLTCCELVS